MAQRNLFRVRDQVGNIHVLEGGYSFKIKESSFDPECFLVVAIPHDYEDLSTTNIILFDGLEHECHAALDKIWGSMYDGVQGSRVVFFEGYNPRPERDLTEDEIEFYDHLKKWNKDTKFTSSATKMVNDPSYQAIIAMGEKVVPIILRHMEQYLSHGGHLSTALFQITGENPVPKKIAGQMQNMSRAWVSWGRKNGHLEKK